MKNQNIILPAIVSTALATSALAQQVEVISAGGAEAAGFFQPYETERIPALQREMIVLTGLADQNL